jgi:hypothetical protein
LIILNLHFFNNFGKLVYGLFVPGVSYNSYLLHKQDHEVLAKFIKGLPEKLTFFVHAGNPKDSATALSAARMGEAYDSCIGRSNGCSRT